MDTFRLLIFIIILALVTFAPILIAYAAQKLDLYVKKRLEARTPTLPRAQQPPAEHTPPLRSLEVLHARLPPVEVANQKFVAPDELAARSDAMIYSAQARRTALEKSTGASRLVLGQPLDVRRGVIVAILLGPPRSIDPH